MWTSCNKQSTFILELLSEVQKYDLSSIHLQCFSYKLLFERKIARGIQYYLILRTFLR